MFFRCIAPGWDSGGPTLLGADEDGRGSGARVLLLTEDLGAAGYALAGNQVTDDQLHGAIDALVAIHARFWEALPPARWTMPASSVTRAAQAWPPEVFAVHAAAARAAAMRFVTAHAHDLASSERALLDDSLAMWESQLVARTSGGRAVTLIHGDVHFLGNILFTRRTARRASSTGRR